ncbi:MAG: VOC family protein [Acidobacteria bacterium]|nr:VOC family protein [Acidobacteriota bacterium]MBI3423038.1 VOC family protein [Acidobacteriota bacterium]
MQNTATKATFKSAFGYQGDALNLPVPNLAAALPFYETVFGFRVIERADAPHPTARLGRDEIQIGLAENGGDPTQDGCFFAVDNVEAAFAELNANGLAKAAANYRIDQHSDTAWKVFFVIAPDGLCYCLGERQD